MAARASQVEHSNTAPVPVKNDKEQINMTSAEHAIAAYLEENCLF